MNQTKYPTIHNFQDVVERIVNFTEILSVDFDHFIIYIDPLFTRGTSIFNESHHDAFVAALFHVKPCDGWNNMQ